MEITPTLFPLDDDTPPKRKRGSRKDIVGGFGEDTFKPFEWRPFLFVPNLSDTFKTPPKLRRVFIGMSIKALKDDRMIGATGERRSATTGGRHSNIYECWRFAPGVDAARVEEWRQANPIPPEPETAGGHPR